MNLYQRLRQGPVPHTDAALLVAQIADALHYAHVQNVFHRDIKPGNILLDQHGRPHVTDFGLAVQEDELAGEAGRRSGTCPYYSPEQARGEGHHVDGRTDIYSLGAVFYELLCGRPPFDRHSPDVLDQIQHRDPRPLRQINDAVPRELERICLKALSKPVTGRYATAKDMADELRLAVAPPPAAAPAPGQALPPATQSAIPNLRIPNLKSEIHHPPRIVPKGLRSFGPEDSDFFLELLPGPRGRDGLPDSIRFWKTRIESRDAEQTFAVGLIYGPTGCGKSSLVKAGLLPQLARSVAPVYVEATRDETELRLASSLRRACPSLPSGRDLADMLTALRRGQGLPAGQKLLIVLDQFEQWLHVHGHDMARTELVRALRQADGENVQVILMVRDDFWMGISRLFETLEINLDRDRNTRAVDLFDLEHAQHVLLLFGQAFGRLPSHAAELTAEQADFLDRAVNELSQDGLVISVRLSLFADLMKGRPWTLASLVEVGGTAGVGVRFLEESLTSRTAVPELRALADQARALLRALLPEGGTDIKGHMRSRQELAAACGLPEDSHRFARLIEILDHDLHIITPTEVEKSEISNLESQIPDLYQLTHDYLVPPLRQWLTNERRRTWRGRAELALEDRTAQMQRWPQSHYLPSPAEYVSILLAVRHKSRRPEQRALMRQATRHYGLRWGSALATVLLAAIVVQQYVGSVRRAAASREVNAAVVTAVGAAPADFPTRVAVLRRDEQTIQRLREFLHDEAGGRRERLHAAFCLLHFQGNQERDALNFVVDAIPWAGADECTNFVTFLRPVADAVTGTLLDRCRTGPQSGDRARYATILLQLGDRRGAEHVLKLRPNPADRTEFIHEVFPTWHARLGFLSEAFSQSDVMLDDEDVAAFRSGLCAAISLIPPSEIDDRDFVIGLLTRLFLHAPDGGTHSAADYALRKLGVSAPSVERTTGPPPGRRWFVNSLGMAMVEIPAGTLEIGSGDQGRTIQIERPFFMQDREVSLEQFRQFYEEFEKTDDAKSAQYRWPGAGKYVPTEDPERGPAQNMTWYTAIRFCNWLSDKEKRGNFYIPTGRGEQIALPQELGGGEVECDQWTTDESANGYRLPSSQDWQYACAARSAEPYCFGSDAALLPMYALTAGSGRLVLERCASRLPNAWGLFDMHGNAAEWCSELRDPLNPTSRRNAEPNLHSPPQWATTIRLSGKNPATGWGTLGIRLVCPAD